MGKKTALFEYRENLDAPVTVRALIAEPDALSSMRRQRLIAEAALDADVAPERARLRKLYIDVISATASADGVPWPLSFETFCALPPALIDQWCQTVWRANAGWLLLVGG